MLVDFFALSRFFSALCDLGVSLGDVTLQESALNMLKILPADAEIVRIIKQKCVEGQQRGSRAVVEDYLTSLPPSHTLYHLVVIHSLLMPGMETVCYIIFSIFWLLLLSSFGLINWDERLHGIFFYGFLNL